MHKIAFLLFTICCLAFAFGATAQQKMRSDTIVFYKVKPKENLYRISLKFNCTMQQLIEWNQLQNPNYVQAGQLLKIYNYPETKLNRLKEVKSTKDSIAIVERNMIRDSLVAKLVMNLLNYDSIAKKLSKNYLKKNYPEDNLLDGTRITPRDGQFDSSGHIKFGAYLSTYYAHYSDSVGVGNYESFPTSAPISNAFSINMLLLGAKYQSDRLRGNFLLHFGDIPSSGWSKTLNMIQEANAGFRLLKGLWLDAGFFRTHIGVESIQPRENITSSIAFVTYFEPYYLSGAKLTYNLTPRLSFQVNTFNGFNTFVESNNNKAFGFSALFDVNSKLSLNLNTIYTDESATTQTVKQPRWYSNFYLTYKSQYLDLALEGNYGIQENSLLKDKSKQAEMYSSLCVAKIKFSKRFAIYGRADYYNDLNEILTGPVLNASQESVGLHLWSATGGFEFKPIANSYLRTEYRYTETIEENQKIFYVNKSFSNIRYEIIGALGFWF